MSMVGSDTNSPDKEESPDKRDNFNINILNTNEDLDQIKETTQEGKVLSSDGILEINPMDISESDGIRKSTSQESQLNELKDSSHMSIHEP